MRLPFSINPVLARESRVRMRGWRAPALITLYVGVLGLVVWAIIMISNASGDTFTPELGAIIFAFLGVAQFILLCFSAPGLTAGAIAGEREKQTLDLLLITRMSPLQVVFGKLGAAVAFTLLLMVASLPVYGLLFLLGGISLGNLVTTVLVYVVTVLLLGAIGIFYSAVFRRTQAAVVAAYGTALGLVVFSFVISLMIFEIFNRGPGDNPPGWATIFGYINPFVGLFAAMGEPVSDITRLYQRVLLTPESRDAMWWKYCIFALSTTAALVWATARRIRPYQEK